MPDQKALGASARDMIQQGADIEEVLTFLRSSGCTMGTSAWVLEDELNWNHIDAKRLLLGSKAWSDLRSTNEALEDEIAKYFRK